VELCVWHGAGAAAQPGNRYVHGYSTRLKLATCGRSASLRRRSDRHADGALRFDIGLLASGSGGHTGSRAPTHDTFGRLHSAPARRRRCAGGGAGVPDVVGRSLARRASDLAGPPCRASGPTLLIVLAGTTSSYRAEPGGARAAPLEKAARNRPGARTLRRTRRLDEVARLHANVERTSSQHARPSVYRRQQNMAKNEIRQSR